MSRRPATSRHGPLEALVTTSAQTFRRFRSKILCTRPAHRDSRAGRVVVHRGAEPLKHEPCRLLRDAQRAVNLHTGNTILAIDHHPETRHPSIKSKRRVLKDRTDLQRELLVATTAEPDAASLDEVVFIETATRANHFAIRPAKADSVVEGPVRIGEVNDGLLESAWRPHVKTVGLLFGCVKYISAGSDYSSHASIRWNCVAIGNRQRTPRSEECLGLNRFPQPRRGRPTLTEIF